ncbi:ATP-grasp domain-containing protein [Endozoicomonas sp. SM1973]|uniref:ATP-grasp domain-containing protein n=1 Tax=Spartinivicinus marinus TaxID=2994442 RepID=A0A853IF14_9GAMM|nr:ATP-grasp domain-containing protein [Spartinivicinus marinus]MCX4027213.1 ATP-grasp domain-containing protein [Spartinivicinus marinus]NYZ66066.1 ATP-grasp domain-containing protein [Spartinivicinus marinus]
MHILFPSDYFKPSQPDEMYQAQAEAFDNKGIQYSTISLDELSPLSRITPAVSNDVIYRGWMLNEQEYQNLCVSIASSGGTPYISVESYLALHHLPNWYELIADLTPETIILPKDCNLELELKNIGWESYFIKDYVKSLKTSVGSIINEPSQAVTVADEMKKFRGKIEGGFCIRKVENFLPDTEERYFVLDGKVFASEKSQSIPEIVVECASRIASRFFSIDLTETKEGKERVVEVGDGQVSDIVGWSPERFARIFVDG